MSKVVRDTVAFLLPTLMACARDPRPVMPPPPSPPAAPSSELIPSFGLSAQSAAASAGNRFDKLVYVTIVNAGTHFDGMRVEVHYGDDAALPSAQCRSPVEGDLNGVVHLNKRAMQDFWLKYGDAGVVGVILHEMAHIVTCPAAKTIKGRNFELLADCLTGDYMAAYYPNNDMTLLRGMWHDLGDFEFGGPGHHGTPQERHIAFTIGFFNRRDGKVHDAIRATVSCLTPLGYTFNL